MAESEQAEVETAPVADTPPSSPRRSGWRLGAGGFLFGVAATLAAVWYWPRGEPAARVELPQSVTPSRLPGELPAFSRLELRADSRSIALAFPLPPSIDRERSATASVEGPNGESLLQRYELDPRQLRSSSALLILQSAEGFTPGVHELRLEQSGLPQPLSLRFELLPPVD